MEWFYLLKVAFRIYIADCLLLAQKENTDFCVSFVSFNFVELIDYFWQLWVCAFAGMNV